MRDEYSITLTEAPDPEDAQAVREGLDQYNRAHVGETGYRPLTLFVRDASGAVIGGLLGGTYWGWMHVDILWLKETLRKRLWRSFAAYGGTGGNRTRLSCGAPRYHELSSALVLPAAGL